MDTGGRMKINSLQSLQKAYQSETIRLGIPEKDAHLIYMRSIAAFGMPAIAGKLDLKILPYIISAVKEVHPEVQEVDIWPYVISIQKELWQWQLCEEVITMQSLFDSLDKNNADEVASMNLIKAFCDDCPRIDGPEQTRFFYNEEPRRNFRIHLDNAQFLIRSLAQRIKFILDPDSLRVIDAAIIEPCLDFDFETGPLPMHHFPTFTVFCGIRWCLYLQFSIIAAEEDPKLEKELTLPASTDIWKKPDIWDW